jgi:beta-lactamase class A
MQQELRTQMQARLEAIASRLDGVLGFVVVDLTSQQRVAARLETQPFPTASTIKLSILYELLKQCDEGRLVLDKPALLERSQVVGGSGVLQHLSAPLLSLGDHAALMMIVSDNTATNVVIDAVGLGNVTSRMKALGLGDILLRRKMMDAAAARRGDENVASPASLARIAELLWRGEGLKKESRDAAVQVMYRVNGSIRGAVPTRVRVASKTGTLEGVRAEAAVVEIEGRPFALAAMTTYLRSDADGERAIRDVADAAFSYFDRLAQGGAYGRKLP